MWCLSLLRSVGLVVSVSGLMVSALRADSSAPEAGQALRQWQDEKFGMFVHWGVYSVPAGVHNGVPVRHLGEWIMHNGRIPKADYAKYAAGFAPEGYDAAAWVALAREAGMKYMMVTAKHHDGFALFDSKFSDWDAVDATPGKRDLLMPIVEECRRQNMRLGFHYSQALDWWHPGGGKYGPAWDKGQEGSFDEYLKKVSVPQIKELINRYGPVAGIFFDTPAEMNPRRAAMIESVLPPSVLINDRLSAGSDSSYMSYEGSVPGDVDRQKPWELCLTINDTYGYKRNDQNWKSSETLLRSLVGAVSQGGNVIVNVGPDASGTIPEPSVKVLREIGGWMRTNGESIYATRRSPYWPVPWDGGCTLRAQASGDTALYLQFYKWPASREVLLPGLANPLRSAQLLAGGAAVETVRKGNSWLLSLPADPGGVMPVVKLVVEGIPRIEASAGEPDDAGKVELTAINAALSGDVLQLERQQDSREINIGFWKEVGDTASWKISLPAAGEYQTHWNVACEADAAGSVIAIMNASSEELGQFEVPSTGGWGTFRPVKGPVLKLPAGLTELRLVPQTKPGIGVVNLRSLTLEKTR